MKFLVLGCNGMAGHTISIYLKEQGHDVTGYARSKSNYINTIVGDVVDFNKLKNVVLDGNYDSVVNCVGVLNQFAEENHVNAILVNSLLPHFLSEITKNTQTQIIQISTDCVFSGKKGQYNKDDCKDGRNFYDRTKALGELENEKDITLRNSIVGPDIKQNGIGLMNWFLQQKKEVNGYTCAIWSGQTTLQLAKTIEAVAVNRSYGLYNAVPDTCISKYELLLLFNKYLRKSKIKVTPQKGIEVDKSLKKTNFEFDYEIPDYESMIQELAIWIKKHKELYPHYDI